MAITKLSAQASKIELEAQPPVLAAVDFSEAALADKEKYQSLLAKWQKRLLAVQLAYFHQGRRAIVVFQGWDASGKGGSIRRVTQMMDPRGFRVYPISAPTPNEQGKHYLYRFQKRLPEPGCMAIFDRSWYERVLVERIEGLATQQQWQRAYGEINEFERLLIDDDVRIVKIFMHITPEEQLKRLIERLNNPMKHWKLTHEDIRNRAKWDQYQQASDDMFAYTSTKAAPWRVIAANKKWYARIEVLKTLVKALERGVDVTPAPLEPELVNALRAELMGV